MTQKGQLGASDRSETEEPIAEIRVFQCAVWQQLLASEQLRLYSSSF
jgi:hypothetical protein